VDSYSSLVAATRGFSNIAVSSAARGRKGIPLITDTWLEGPFGWPPKASLMSLDESTLANVGIKSGDEVFIVKDKTVFLRAGTSSEFNGLIRLMDMKLLVPGEHTKYEFDSCSVGRDGLSGVIDTFAVLRLFYETDFKGRFNKVAWDLGLNVPRMYYKQGQPNNNTEDNGAWEAGMSREFSLNDENSWGPSFFTLVSDTSQKNAPWAGEAASGFFTLSRGGKVPKDALTLGNMLHDTLVCKFDNVMFCGQEGEGGARLRRNIVLCMIISYVIWVCVAALVSTIPLLGSLGVFIRYSMVFLVPVTGIQLAYGMAVTCFPLIPT
jgi:hypothetical protein